MALAAAELYRATGNANYLSDARTYATLAGSRYEFGWGEVAALADYEIARLDSTFMPTATTYLLNDLSAYQAGFNANRFGAVNTSQWGSAAVMAGAALSALWYEDLTGDSTYRRIAQAQRDYLLSNNPWGVSFVNSIGTTWPHYPHHQVADLTGSELMGFWDEGMSRRPRFSRRVHPDAHRCVCRVSIVRGGLSRRRSRLVVETAGGGGFGPPAERPAELLERDVRDELVNPTR